MTTVLALALYVCFFAGFLAFVRFCDWVLSRGEVAS